MTLGPEARKVIEDAEGVDVPRAADKERVRERLAASIGGAIVGATVTAAASKGVGAGTATALKGTGGVVGSALLAKILASVAIVGAVAVAYEAGRRSDVDAVRAAPTEKPIAAAGGAPPAVLPSSVPAPLDSADDAPGIAPAPPRPSLSLSGGSGVRTAPPPPASATASSSPPAKSPVTNPTEAGEGEAALLQRARAAIDAGDGVTALDVLDAHERRFPTGLLAEQRLAERVVALCTIGKGPTTRERAEHFLNERPRSQQADRIRRACGLK